jgi:hypothetical protein
MLGQLLDFIELVIADQNAQMSLVIAFTLAFFHIGSYYFLFRREFQAPPAGGLSDRRGVFLFWTGRRGLWYPDAQR